METKNLLICMQLIANLHRLGDVLLHHPTLEKEIVDHVVQVEDATAAVSLVARDEHVPCSVAGLRRSPAHADALLHCGSDTLENAIVHSHGCTPKVY